MNPLAQPPTRRGHRKRISALRLSSDSTVPTLPVYTSPQWQRPVELLDDPTDLPPDYPDSAEEADEDTDDSAIIYHSPPLSPRRSRRSQNSSRSKPRRSSSNDPYLDSLLARSVHALELSNALLQSSMSTQATLNNVLGRDSQGEESLEAHARNLSSRISGGSNWKEDLDQISRGVEGLFEEGAGRHSREASLDSSTSQSLPASSSMSTVADRIRSHRRRPSFDMRNANLSYSTHDRQHLIAPPPRAFTMYIDSSEDPASVTLPATLGVRPSSRSAATTIPVVTSSPISRPLLLHATGSESDLPKRAVDVLSSFALPLRASSNASSSTASPASSYRNRPRSSSASTSTTMPSRLRASRSPHAASSSRSPIRTPDRSPTSMLRQWDTPPIVELPSASSSSSSDDLHVDRTVSYLRNILESNPPLESPDKGKQRMRPSFLTPPPVNPVADASNTTTSVSRLFTKPRHTTSTRPPSPPRHSALKGRSGRSAPPTPTSPTLSMSSSWLSISDAIGVGGSGRSTPNRVSFIEPPDAKKDKDKTSLRKSRSRSRSRRGKAGDSDSGDGSNRWWSWLVGQPGTSGHPVPTYVRQEERLVRASGWGPRSGFGGSMEEWGV